MHTQRMAGMDDDDAIAATNEMLNTIRTEIYRIERSAEGGLVRDEEYMRERYRGLMRDVQMHVARHRITNPAVQERMVLPLQNYFGYAIANSARLPTETLRTEYKDDIQTPAMGPLRRRFEGRYQLSTQPAENDAEPMENEPEFKHSEPIPANTSDGSQPAGPSGRPADEWDYDPWDAADIKSSVKESSHHDEL